MEFVTICTTVAITFEVLRGVNDRPFDISGAQLQITLRRLDSIGMLYTTSINIFRWVAGRNTTK
jgi:hypothetical protein